jgi:hypothetical protein
MRQLVQQLTWRLACSSCVAVGAAADVAVDVAVGAAAGVAADVAADAAVSAKCSMPPSALMAGGRMLPRAHVHTIGAAEGLMWLTLTSTRLCTVAAGLMFVLLLAGPPLWGDPVSLADGLDVEHTPT